MKGTCLNFIMISAVAFSLDSIFFSFFFFHEKGKTDEPFSTYFVANQS